MTDSDEIEISLRKLRRSYVEGQRHHEVLDGITIDFGRGESVAIRGRSGSGKSTLLNLIGGIDAPDSGQIMVSGVNIGALSERNRTLFRREKIGFVYQAFNLIPTLTVADNVRLVLELNGMRGVIATRRIVELLDAVGLADRRDSYPDILSGGEQQRVAIARALCHEPAVILADEPTGNLDEANADAVLNLLEKLVHRRGGTMLVATHSTHVASFCDRVVELHDGVFEEPAKILRRS